MRSQSTSSRLRAFLLELRHRKVHRVAAMYAAGVFIVLQVASIVVPAFRIPGWSLAVMVVVSLLGLPVALALAWVFEITPEGLRRTVSLEEEAPGAASLALPALLFVTSLALITASSWWLMRPEVDALPAVAPPDSERPSLAVLPFADRSIGRGEEAEFFAEGMHDELLTQLARIGTLTVLSRGAVLGYRASPKSARMIGEELGVGAVVEGSVQTAGGRLRLSVQLVNARTDEHLWAESYDRPLSVDSIFALQQEVAGQIAAALEARLAPADAARVADVPTGDLEAYDFYLRGNLYAGNRFIAEPARTAIEMYSQAVELDSTFALAWAKLSAAQSIFFSFFDPTPARRELAAAALQRALRLAPALPETRLAEGYFYYWVQMDFERALEALEAVRRVQPNNDELYWVLGSLQRRHTGIEASQASLSRALELNPRSHLYHMEVGVNHQLLGDYPRAEHHFGEAVRLAPEWPMGYFSHAFLYLQWDGHEADALRALREVADRFGMPTALAMLVSHRGRFHLARVGGEFHDALARASLAQAPFDSAGFYLARGEMYGRRGEAARARASFDSARVVLEGRRDARPGEPSFHGELALAYAGLGRRAEALREAERAVTLLPTMRDPLSGGIWVLNLIHVLILAGEYDAALDRIEDLPPVPWRLTARQLREHPYFAPLRPLPRFQRLLRSR